LKNSNIWIIAALAIGLMLGLAIGLAISRSIIIPEKILCIINPVQVSGTIHGVIKGTIQFVNFNEAESTRYEHHVQIVNEQYNITLSGGQPYTVNVGLPGISGPVPYAPGEIFVPSNVTTFSVDFS